MFSSKKDFICLSVSCILLEKQTTGYKSGSGTLDNRANNGTLILGQNIETDGVVGREDKKLYGQSLMGMKQVNNNNVVNTIKGTINSSTYSNG